MEIFVPNLPHPPANRYSASGGGFGFVASALLAMAGIVLLLDRVGAPATLVGILAPVFGLLALAVLGLATRSMRISDYFAAGRDIPASYAGLGLAGLALALALPVLPHAAGLPYLAAPFAGLAGGMVLAALGSGPLLRKSGAFSLAGLLGGRFPGRTFRLASLALVALTSAIAGLAGLLAASHTLALASGLGMLACLGLTGCGILLACLPGGLSGALWAAVVAAASLAGALGISLGLAAFQHIGVPLPLLGEPGLMQKALAGLAAYGGRAAQASSQMPIGVLALGFAALAPVAGVFAATPRPDRARPAGLTGLAWGAALALGVLAAIAMAALALERDLAGQRPENLPPLVYRASAGHELRLCGHFATTPAAARTACAATPGFTGVLRAEDIDPGNLALLAGLVMSRDPPAAVSALVLAAVMLVELALAALSFQTLAGALAHEGFYHLRDSAALTSRRLAIARLTLVACTGGAIVLCAGGGPEPGWLVLACLGLSTAFLAPLLALALWPLATTRDAALALAAGSLFAFVGAPAALAGYDDLFALAETVFGVSLATGVAASLFHPASARPQWFFQALRVRGAEIFPPDKGA